MHAPQHNRSAAMALFTTSSMLFPPYGGDDHVMVQRFDDRLIIALADGAGGLGGAAQAARFACERAIELAAFVRADGDTWAARLVEIDAELSRSVHGGQTTLVVAEVWNESISGASVGDSRAWMLAPDAAPFELTSGQSRKPLLGSGLAIPNKFEQEAPKGWRLLMASDGLHRHGNIAKLLHTAFNSVIHRTPALLLDLVLLPNGEVHDDVAIVLCEPGCDREAIAQDIRQSLPLAQQGGVEAINKLAECYEALDQDVAAAHWFKQAADAGDVEACYDIGIRNVRGRGVTKDLQLADHYYQLGLQRGCGLAICNLGYHYEHGDRGLERNPERALDCYQRSSELGCATGQFNLAKAYQFGKFGLAPDLQRAATLFRAAARQDPHAMVGLGDCHEKGIGVPVNYAEAESQFRRAMLSGHNEAVWRLGLLYELGLGVVADDRQATRLYAEAAQHGCAPAQRCLANMYLHGRGIEADRRLALHWMRLAVHAGDERAREALVQIEVDEDPAATGLETRHRAPVHAARDGTS